MLTLSPAFLLIMLRCTLPSTAATADPLPSLIDQLASCLITPFPTLAVAGFEPGESVVSDAQAEEVRLSIQNRLQDTGRVRLAAAGDVGRLMPLLHGPEGGVEAQERFRQAFKGDAVVFFASPTRSADQVSFRLLALSHDPTCSITSEPVRVALRVGPSLQDVDSQMRNAIDSLVTYKPRITAVTVCPFESADGYSSCAPVLTERLTSLLDRERRSTDFVMSDHKLDIRRANPGMCPAGDEEVTAHGRFEQDTNGRSWMQMEFRRGPDILARTDRISIVPEDLGCDPRTQPFLAHVAASARNGDGALRISAAKEPFRAGDFLDLRIRSEAELSLYCWVLAPDETAFVALPVAGAENRSRVSPGRTYSYPGADFGTEPIQLGGAFENLFGCFGVPGELPADLHGRWMAFAPGQDRDPAVLGRDDVLNLIEVIRAQPGVVEAYAPVVVR